MLGCSVDFVALTLAYVDRNLAMGEHMFQFGERTYVVNAGVFSPHVFEDTAFFTRALPIRPGECVLEIGCGAGVLAVEAALAGAASVMATDISPQAVANARANAVRHDVGHILNCHVSDLFSAMHYALCFDIIFWNAPFICADEPYAGALAAAVFDPEYRSIARYLRDAPKFIKPDGHIFLGFSSTSGDKERLDEVARQARLRLELVARECLSDSTCTDFSLELYRAEAF